MKMNMSAVSSRSNSVEMRARVSGYLEAIHFQDGQIVKKGDLLFTIDRRPFKTVLAQAQASLAQARANLAFAESDLARAKVLPSAPSSPSKLSTNGHRRSAWRRQQSRRKRPLSPGSARSRIHRAARPRFPDASATGASPLAISSRAEHRAIPACLPLSNRSIPFASRFTVDEASYLRYAHSSKNNADAANRGLTVPVKLKLIDEPAYSHEGRLDFVDNAIDRSSSTIRARAVFANPNAKFTPGMFARVGWLLHRRRLHCSCPTRPSGPSRRASSCWSSMLRMSPGRNRSRSGPRRWFARHHRRPEARRHCRCQRTDAGAPRCQGHAAAIEHRLFVGCRLSGSGPIEGPSRPCASPTSSSTGRSLPRWFRSSSSSSARFPRRLPVAQYPEIAPPVVRVSGQYPGASADVVAATVVAPLEQEINGVENMIYIASNSTGDGRFQIDVTFELGTNLDIAQVQVQNRVATAQPRVPADVRNIGVTTAKSSPDLMMVVNLYSPDKSRDTLFISNYAKVEITDVLSRIKGVGSIAVFGARDYAMRIWLDPDRLQSLSLTTGDVVTALQGQNVQVASGVLNQPPVAHPRAFQVAVRTLGRLADPNEFADIVVKKSSIAVVRLKDVARVELAAVDYSTNSYRDLDPAVALGIFQLPGSNALATAATIRSTMEELSRSFPPGLKYTIIYNPTEFIQQSIDAVTETIAEAIVLVVLVVILFLQTWRAAIIPIVAIPVSLIGTFFFMAALGFSLNNLSLFGLVLAIGIVVDDAIVVVENVERNIAAGLSPRDAARRSMDEVGSALIAIALVLCAVFVPAAFITGISGQFYRQFALTIAGATVISLIVSLTLSPAMCSLLLKPHTSYQRNRWWLRPIRGFFRAFNFGFDTLGRGYGWLAARVVRFVVLTAVVYTGVILFGLNEFRKAPVGFIPQVDQGYLIIVTQLPGGASLARTDEVNRRAVEIGPPSSRNHPRGQLSRLLRRHLHQRSQLGRRLRRA